MTIRKSGLWCDICNKPILRGEWWNALINGSHGHSCQECKDRYEKVKFFSDLPLSEDEIDENS
jgi:ribosome-binding protein aMBF1 (putative translation factor)